MKINESSAFAEWGTLATSLGLLLSITIPSIVSFIKKPNDNDQSEQSEEDVNSYLRELNDRNRRAGKKFEWGFPKDFMYLYVHFE